MAAAERERTARQSEALMVPPGTTRAVPGGTSSLKLDDWGIVIHHANRIVERASFFD